MGIGLTGIEVYDLLRDEYDIQIEMNDFKKLRTIGSIADYIESHK